MGGSDGSVLLGFLLLAVAAAPVVVRRLSRRRRLLTTLAGATRREVPTDPAVAAHPSRPRTFEITLGSVDATGTWRPRGVAWLTGRNGLILAVDVALLAVIAGVAMASVDPPGEWLVILGSAALLPLASAVLALRALGDRPAVTDHAATRRDVVAAWAGWMTMGVASVVAWLGVALLGLGLVLGGGT